jgi:hypothetical protein
MKIHSSVLKFDPLEIKHGLDDIKIRIATLVFEIDFNIQNNSKSSHIEIEIAVKNNPYYLHGKYYYDDIESFFIVGARHVEFNHLLHGEKNQIFYYYPRRYIILYNKEKKCIDIKIDDNQKTVVNDFELRLIQQQIEKAKYMIAQERERD